MPKKKPKTLASVREQLVKARERARWPAMENYVRVERNKNTRRKNTQSAADVAKLPVQLPEFGVLDEALCRRELFLKIPKGGLRVCG